MTTTVTKGVGAGKDFTTIAALRAYINALDLLALDQDVIIEFYENFTLVYANMIPLTADATRRVRMRPAAGLGVNDLHPNTYDYETSGVELTFDRSSGSEMHPGMFLSGFRIHITGNAGQGSGLSLVGHMASFGAGIRENTVTNCRILDSSLAGSSAAVLVGGSSNYGQLARNLIFVEGNNTNTVIIDASSGTNGGSKVSENTFVARGNGLGAPALTGGYAGGGDRYVNNVFIGFGGTIINKGSETTIDCRANFSNTTPTSAVTGLTTVLGAGVLVLNELTNPRPAAGSALIGAALHSADNTSDLTGIFVGTSPDVGAVQRTAAVVPVAPVVTITSVTVVGQKVTENGTFTGVVTGSSAVLNPAAAPNGAVAASGVTTLNTGAGTYQTMYTAVPGNYLKPATTLTNTGGSSISSGGAPLTVAVPAVPVIVITSQTKTGTTLNLSGTHTGYPVSASLQLNTGAVPNGAVAKGPTPIVLNADGTWSISVTGIAYGGYAGPVASATNFSGTGTATGIAFTLYANGTQPPGLPAVDLIPYAAPAFAAPTIAINATVTDAKLESLSGASQVNVPFTFGQVFAKGHVPPGVMLIGRIAGETDIPLQVNCLSSHPDGSVMHAAVSGILPALTAAQTKTVALVRVAASTTNTNPVASSVFTTAGFSAAAELTIGGVLYTAVANAASLPASLNHLNGSVCQEFILNLPIKTAGGVPHPMLTAQFAVRAYAGQNRARVDFVLENTKAYDSTIDVIADVVLKVAGVQVYAKAGLVHFPCARWKRTAWWGGAPALNIKQNSTYLIASKIVPNYDQSIVMAEATLASYATALADITFDPMGQGRFTAYMGTTGGRPDIGLMPDAYAAAVLSMDSRAKAVTFASGDIGGSWPTHRRDTSTGPGAGRPISVINFPYTTEVGTTGDAQNSATGQNEKFPVLTSSSTLVPDSAHHPALAYLPYLLSCDYYYLEELHFWTNWVISRTNPGYRLYTQGLINGDQVRGQGWVMRTIGEAAAITPDVHPDKSAFQYWLNNNLDWYNAQYTDGTDNALGVITCGAAMSYSTNGGQNNGLAPWQDDFFTSAIGHLSELGFVKATRFLLWKAKFQIGRMIATGYCYIDSCTYNLQVKDNNATPYYASLATALQKTLGDTMYNLPCNSQARLDALNARDNPKPLYVLGEIVGYASSTSGFPSNYQPALAMSVDTGYSNGDLAWIGFRDRTVKPNYNTSPQFAIVPRSTGQIAPTLVVDMLISPATATVLGGTTQQFSWVVNGTGAITQGATITMTGAGSVNGAGLYTAPAATSIAQTASVKATSTSDPSKFAIATITIPAANAPTITSVTVAPQAPTVLGLDTLQLIEGVTGTNNPNLAVTWSVLSGVGTVSASGMYSAPAPTAVVQTATVMARSNQDPSKFGVTTISIPASLVAIPNNPVYPSIVAVLQGVTYGPNGADYTGSYVPSVSGPSGPTTAEIAAAVWNYQTALTVPAFIALK